MSKFGALYKNEMIKIFHKKALAVVIAITILVVFAIGMFVKAFEDSVFGARTVTGIKSSSVYYAIDELKSFNNDKAKESAKNLKEAVDRYASDHGDDVAYDKIGTDIYSILSCYKEAFEANGTYGYPLTEDRYDYLMNRAAILEYRITECRAEYLSSNSGDILNTQVTKVMIWAVFSVTVVLIIILAGSTISHEISSGSIKSLIIAPVRRSKIFWAKLLAVLTTGICVYLIEYLLICIYCLILFGFDDSYFAFVIGTKIYSMSVYLKNLVIILVSYLVITAFASIAIMLSSVSRNTAASVGGSMGIYYAGNIASGLLPYLINPVFIKFIPFTHFQNLFSININERGTDVFNLIFRYAQNDSYNFFRAGTDSSFAFSAIYVVLFTALMLWIAHDSFTKRDI